MRPARSIRRARPGPPTTARYASATCRVVLEREEQRDVDVDPVGQHLLDRRPAFLVPGILIMTLGRSTAVPEPTGLRDRPGGVARQCRRYLSETNRRRRGPIVDRAEQIGGVRWTSSIASASNIADIAPARGRQAADGLVVVVVSPMACSKMVGFDVIPRRPASISPASSPERSCPAGGSRARRSVPAPARQHPGAGVGGCRHRVLHSLAEEPLDSARRPLRA